MGPGLRDWALLAVSLAFVAMAVVLLLAGREPRTALICLLFFGACAAVGGDSIARKRRAARQLGDPGLAVHIEAGQEIRADARRPAWVSAGLVGFGALGVTIGGGLGVGFVVCCALMGLLGLGALAAMGLGYTWRSSLRFEAEALWVSTGRLSYPVPWDSIVAVDLAELHEQPVVRITVADADALLAAVLPAAAAGRLARMIGWSRGLYGADVVVMPRAYGIDEAVLLRAIARYAGEPAARAELVERAALAGPPR